MNFIWNYSPAIVMSRVSCFPLQRKETLTIFRQSRKLMIISQPLSERQVKYFKSLHNRSLYCFCQIPLISLNLILIC